MSAILLFAIIILLVIFMNNRPDLTIKSTPKVKLNGYTTSKPTRLTILAKNTTLLSKVTVFFSFIIFSKFIACTHHTFTKGKLIYSSHSMRTARVGVPLASSNLQGRAINHHLSLSSTSSGRYSSSTSQNPADRSAWCTGKLGVGG